MTCVIDCSESDPMKKPCATTSTSLTFLTVVLVQLVGCASDTAALRAEIAAQRAAHDALAERVRALEMQRTQSPESAPQAATVPGVEGSTEGPMAVSDEGLRPPSDSSWCETGAQVLDVDTPRETWPIDFDRLTRETRIIPRFSGGEVIGMQMHGVAPESPLAAMGVVSGDTLLAVDGMAMNAAENALSAFSRLAEPVLMRLLVKRGDTLVCLRITPTSH